MNKVFVCVLTQCVIMVLSHFHLVAQVVPGPELNDTADYPYWVEMMQDPDANYFTTVHAFEKYWNNRTITKGCGWKVFKRWEYIMRGRIYPDGRKPKPDAVYNEWQRVKSAQRSAGGSWLSLGPSDIPQPGPAGYLGLGRLNVIAFHPTNQDKLFVGAPSGGFWLTNDNGSTWTTTTDQMPTIGISAIIVDYVNPQIIYIGTGDRDHGDAPGLGVFKSIDGGLTWTESKTGMNNVTVCKMIQHPGSASILLAATTSGIFKTTNGGMTWSQTASGDFKDICFKPGDPGIVYAESSSDFYRSSNTGQTFNLIMSGLTTGQRGAIAVTPANPSYVYFLQSDNTSGFKGVYRSTDSGLNFSTQSTAPNILDWSCDGSGTGGQGWYDLVIAADPVNAEIVYVGGINVWKSNDGGVSWTINSHWYGGCSVPAVHADCHFLGFSPVNNRLYAGNDGGIYFTGNGGSTWTDCTVGMTIGQIYKIGQSQTDKNMTINGFQDNGTYTNMSSGWYATGGGDGMECAVDYSNSAITYHTIYFGDVFRKINNASEAKIAGNGVFGIDESGDWVTPFILGESDPKEMFIGYKNVWHCPDATAASPQWNKISDGESSNCFVLEQSPDDPDLLYAVRWNSLVRCENINSPTPVWIPCNLPDAYTPTDLEAHPTEPGTVYATAGNKVYKSIDKGNSWNIFPGVLPDIPINTIVYDTTSSEGLYIGSQTGVMYKNSTMSSWVNFSSGFPVADVRELEIYYSANPANNRLMACTFGRGLWKSDLYYPPDSPPVANFSFNPQIPCPGEAVQITDISLNNPTSWNWSFLPSTISFINQTNSQSQHPAVQFNETTNYQVLLIAGNSHGSSQSTMSVPVGGPSIPMNESFESGSIPPSWSVYNPDAAITWSITSTGGNINNTKSVYVDCFNYTSAGQIDELILSPLSLKGSLHPWLSFRVAYRRWGSGYSDGLKVFISTDCGMTWLNDPIYDKSGSVLATGPDQQDPFVPASSSDWRVDSIDLTPYKNMSVSLKFQAINGWGNNLYIDDISLTEHSLYVIQNQMIAEGTTQCFNATQTIELAGNGTWFHVLGGGSVTLVAGQKLIFHPGVTVFPNGYLHGYIDINGNYCNEAEHSVIDYESVDDGNFIIDSSPMSRTSEIKISPIPAVENFRITTSGFDEKEKFGIEMYDLKGNKVFLGVMYGNDTYFVDLFRVPPGVYILKLKTDHIVKIFKQIKIR